MTFGSLFSGIGGLELGLERAGMTVKWQVEQDTYALKVLQKHWPKVPKHPDVRNVGAHCLEPVELICGGFPCQDISVAGKGVGIDGPRSGLWSEFHRLVCELRPRFVLVENVSALLVRGLDRVLGDLAASGYDAEWDCIPASAVGAPHRRDRVFIVAHAAGKGLEGRVFPQASWPIQRQLPGGFGRAGTRWPLPPNVSGVGHGLPDWMDRLRCLGNAVVPAVAELIGRRIMEAA